VPTVIRFNADPVPVVLFEFMSRYMSASPTVPASPRGESSMISTSADSQQRPGGSLLRYEETKYLQFYGID